MSDTEPILPVYHKGSNNVNINKRNVFFSLKMPFSRLGWTTIFSSFFSFFFCVIWSIIFNFKEANATHCSVENFLPSISAAVGHYYPQIYVWTSSTILQMYPRLKISSMNYYYLQSIIYEKDHYICETVWILHQLELWSLLALSVVTSTTNYRFHAFCFTCFLFSSMLHMILLCYLLKFKRKIPPGNTETKSLKWKFNSCGVNIFCFLVAVYFFQRHNTYCEPRVYSAFAFFEYGVVLSNMFFHSFAIFDFYDRNVCFSVSSVGLSFDFDPPFKSVQYTIR